MKYKIIKLTRFELYNKIWEEPIQKLAKEFQMSDVGLAKICRKYNIPRPPRGYWMKKKAGKNCTKLKLPESETRYGNIIQFHLNDEYSKRLHSSIKIKKSTEVINVDNNGEYRHEITLKTFKYLIASKPNKVNSLITHKIYAIDHIQVSQKSLDRALRILDAIILSLELNNFKVIWDKLSDILKATKNDISITFRIHEKLSISEETIPSRVKPGNNQHSSEKPKYSHIPTGALILKLDRHHNASGVRTLWTDSKYKNLEYYINDITANCLLMIDVIIECERKEIVNDIYTAIEKKQCEKMNEQKHFFDHKMQVISDLYEKWVKFNSFRDFVNELRLSIFAYQFSNEINDRDNELIKMAEYKAMMLDPFNDIEKLLREFNKLPYYFRYNY